MLKKCSQCNSLNDLDIFIMLYLIILEIFRKNRDNKCFHNIVKSYDKNPNLTLLFE